MGQRQLNAEEVIDTDRTLVAGDKGRLAPDESDLTRSKRSAALEFRQPEEAWRPTLHQREGGGGKS